MLRNDRMILATINNIVPTAKAVGGEATMDLLNAVQQHMKNIHGRSVLRLTQNKVPQCVRHILVTKKISSIGY